MDQVDYKDKVIIEISQYLIFKEWQDKIGAHLNSKDGVLRFLVKFDRRKSYFYESVVIINPTEVDEKVAKRIDDLNYNHRQEVMKMRENETKALNSINEELEGFKRMSIFDFILYKLNRFYGNC